MKKHLDRQSREKKARPGSRRATKARRLDNGGGLWGCTFKPRPGRREGIGPRRP